MASRTFNSAPVIIGTEVELLPEEERPLPELSHRWRCYVNVQPEVVKSVQFRLHESFANPVVTITEPPFQIMEHGWGEFMIQIKITLFNDEKIMTSQPLVLHSETHPVVNERLDTIVYRGEAVEIEREYDYPFRDEDAEYQRIDEAINYLLEQYKKIKAGAESMDP